MIIKNDDEYGWCNVGSTERQGMNWSLLHPLYPFIATEIVYTLQGICASLVLKTFKFKLKLRTNPKSRRKFTSKT